MNSELLQNIGNALTKALGRNNLEPGTQVAIKKGQDFQFPTEFERGELFNSNLGLYEPKKGELFEVEEVTQSHPDFYRLTTEKGTTLSPVHKRHLKKVSIKS
jgi:hypothetical protein